MNNSRSLLNTTLYLLLLLASASSVNCLAADQTGFFVDETSERLSVDTGQAARSGSGDIDNDGDIDFIVPGGAYTGGPVPLQDFLLQINDGVGQFTNEASLRLPDTAFETQYAAAVVLDDFDGDGDLDVFVANGTSLVPPVTPVVYQNRLWINDGAGVFSDQTQVRLPDATNPTFHASTGDIDGDGDIDIVVGNVRDQNRILVNNGSGYFTDETASRLPAISDITLAVLLKDLDDDNDLDLVVANRSYGGSKILINNGAGEFTDESASRFISLSAPWAGDIKVADLNSDGHVDIIFSSILYGPFIYINNGSGYFADESLNRTPSYYNTHSLAVADFDRDGDADVFVSIVGFQQSVLLLNDGNGYFSDFTNTNLPSFNDDIRYPACGDVDNDGDPDIYLGVTFNDQTSHQDKLLINAGNPIVLLEDLIVTTVGLGLPRNTERSLLRKLNKALQKLTNNNTNDDIVALLFLNDFISIVDSKLGSVISPEDARMLIDSAEDIIDRLSNPAECV